MYKEAWWYLSTFFCNWMMNSNMHYHLISIASLILNSFSGVGIFFTILYTLISCVNHVFSFIYLASHNRWWKMSTFLISCDYYKNLSPSFGWGCGSKCSQLLMFVLFSMFSCLLFACGIWCPDYNCCCWMSRL